MQDWYRIVCDVCMYVGGCEPAAVTKQLDTAISAIRFPSRYVLALASVPVGNFYVSSRACARVCVIVCERVRVSLSE